MKYVIQLDTHGTVPHSRVYSLKRHNKSYHDCQKCCANSKAGGLLVVNIMEMGVVTDQNS